MAIIKHVNIKNSDYSKALEYLLYKHDESRNKLLLDSDGKKIFRENYLMEGINCNPDTFDMECREANKRFGKNNRKDEVKAHHYILSFDPKDKTDNGLTMERAQKIGMEFARKNFKGHQVIVCTHDDGHNRSGNIHCHIVINSLRIEDVPHEPYMTQRSDFIAGGKHRCSDEFFYYLRGDLMETCEKEKLYQIDLLTHPRVRESEREYWAKRRGLKFDKNFKTFKESLREIIYEVSKRSKSLDEFEKTLFDDYRIDVKYSRGKIAYILPDREKPIRGRALGTDFEKEHILSVVNENASRGKYKSQVRHISDLTNNPKAQNFGYAKVVGLDNIKKEAETFNFMSRNGIKDINELEQYIASGEAFVNELYDNYSKLKSEIEDINRKTKLMGQYLSTKAVYADYLKSSNKKLFREHHADELSMYEAARKELQSLSPDGKFESLKELKAKRDELYVQKNYAYEELSFHRAKLSEYKNARDNLRYLLGEKREPDKQINNMER